VKLMLVLVSYVLLTLPVAHSETLTVAVAANVKYAFDEIADEFTKSSGVSVNGVFASAGKIAAQVKSGAPYDVFLSADTEFPDGLYRQGLALAPSRVYAYGTLVLWTVKDFDLGKGMSVVGDASVRKIAIANPKLAPYGRAALEALGALDLKEAAQPKLVFGESIGQTSQYIESGAADIGFTAKSVVLAPELHGKGKWIEVPKDSYQPIAQGVVVLKHGAETQADSARKFMDFLFSDKARAILKKYGYTLP
jgi:molybdate transport system substrate-binding protein